MVDRYIGNDPDAVPMNISTPVPFKNASSRGGAVAPVGVGIDKQKSGSIFQRLGGGNTIDGEMAVVVYESVAISHELREFKVIDTSFLCISVCQVKSRVCSPQHPLINCGGKGGSSRGSE